MTSNLKLTFKSLWNRKITTLLTLLSIAVSSFLVLSIEKIRVSTKQSFEGTLSRVDLIVGARSSPLQILLYSVFRIGDATNNIRYETFEKITQMPEVEFAIPISLGDSHRGYRVVGTNTSYFEKYRFRGNQSLDFSEGRAFNNLFDVVIGSDIAKKLNYKIGQKIILSHGTGTVSFQDHSDTPFEIVGILKPTQTPVDQSIHVSLEAIEAIHVGWESGAPENLPSKEDLLKKQFKVSQITAALVGLKSRTQVFKVKRELDESTYEPISAILPGVVLTDLWRNLGFIERVLKILTFVVFASSLVTLLLALLTSLNERRREMAILRSLGAQPLTLFNLFFIESIFVCLLGLSLGVLLNAAVVFLLSPLIEAQFGLLLNLKFLTLEELKLLGLMALISIGVGFIPAFSAYKKSLADGLSVRN